MASPKTNEDKIFCFTVYTETCGPVHHQHLSLTPLGSCSCIGHESFNRRWRCTLFISKCAAAVSANIV